MKTNTTEKPTPIGLIVLSFFTVPLYLLGLERGGKDWNSATDWDTNH